MNVIRVRRDVRVLRGVMPEIGGFYLVHGHEQGVWCWEGARDRGCVYQPTRRTQLKEWLRAAWRRLTAPDCVECGHSRTKHEHYRRGTDCSARLVSEDQRTLTHCPCPAYSRSSRARLP